MVTAYLSRRDRQLVYVAAALFALDVTASTLTLLLLATS